MEYPFKDLQPLDEATARTGYYKDWTHIDANTFHQITELAKFIREKGYGADVREAIAQALERVYHDASKSGNANMEVSIARKDFKDLASRLDASDGKLSSAGSEIAGAKRGYQSLFESLNNLSFGMFNINLGKITPNMVSDELLAQIAGDAAVNAVPADGSITSEKLADKAVSPIKLQGARQKYLSVNLFDKATATIGSYVATDTGEIRSGQGSYALSDYYPVTNEAYRKTGTLFTAFYKDKNGNLSDTTKAVTGLTFTPPSDANFARSTILTADLDTAMITKNIQWPQTYQPYHVTYELDKDLYNLVPSSVTTKRTRNLFNPDTVTFGGYYDTNGQWVNVPTYGLSDFIEVNPGEVLSKLTTGISTWYDANNVRVGSWTTTRQTRVPSNAKYVRAITNSGNVTAEMVVRGYDYPSEYIPYEINTFDETMDVLSIDEMRALTTDLYGKKWAYLGDSISDYLFSYPHLIAPKYNMNLTHMALAGRSMAKRGTTTDNQYPPLINIYQNVPEDVDYITIWIGTNDKGSNVAIGTLDSVDETTFMGAYNVMLSWLIDNRPDAKILLITPMQRSDAVGQTGTPLIDYVEAVKQIGAKYGFKVLDMYRESGLYVHSQAIKDKYIPDGLHPNFDGHKRIAPVIESAIKSI